MDQVVVAANGVRFTCLTAGAGPLALCLHGFPDSATTWRHLLPELAAAGYRAVAPFMRGYAPTEVPVDGRTGAELVADVLALHAALGGDERAVVIGHDWGAGAVWGALVADPARFRRAVAIAVPPLGAQSLDLSTPGQQRRSWYSFLFQAITLAEACTIVAADDYAFIDRLWRDWSPGFDATGETPAVKRALTARDHLGAAISYYTQVPSFLGDPAAVEDSRRALQAVPTPVLYLHGRDCGCIGLDVVEVARPFFPPNTRVEILDGVGHFAHVERPDLVNRLILDFLANG